MLCERSSRETTSRGRTHRIRNWTRLKAKDLWDVWRQQFDCDDDAIMTAIWMANRLVKDRALTSRRTFYSIKDEAIRRYAVGLSTSFGKRAREEVKTCWTCGGSGESPYWEGEPCDRCDNGVYSRRWLYLHEFSVAGVPYKLHSYVEPKQLLDNEPDAETVEQYGGRFTEEEWTRLALPFSGLLRLLTYVAAAKWNLKLYDQRYR